MQRISRVMISAMATAGLYMMSAGLDAQMPDVEAGRMKNVVLVTAAPKQAAFAPQEGPEIPVQTEKAQPEQAELRAFILPEEGGGADGFRAAERDENVLETTIEGATHVIINISGDITLFDASDAAEYVQDLVGEETNIIFGAMYDDSKADEATITVIATGLHNVGGTASKLKSRLEGKVPTIHSMEKYEAPVVPTPVMPELDLGLANPAYAKPAQGTAAGTAPTLQTPRTPVSQVKEQAIKIPTFLKK